MSIEETHPHPFQSLVRIQLVCAHDRFSYGDNNAFVILSWYSMGMFSNARKDIG